MFDPNTIARARSVPIAAVLASRGHRLRCSGSELIGPCPTCGGRDRFAVNLKKSVWNCRGCGKGGDVIALVQHLSGCDFTAAIEQLTGEIWPTPQFAAAPQRQPTQSSPHRTAALRIWREAGSIFGTPAQAYLTTTRKTDLAQIPDVDEVLRHHTACPIGQMQRLPCLIALIRDIVSNAPIGIMRTPLSADGRKEPVRNESGELIDRWALGDKAGGAIKLWEDAAVTTGLVVGEGLETVAAAATRIEHRGTLLCPAWALIDKGNLQNFPVLPGIEALTILVDNDESGDGQKAASVCARRWLDAEREVIRLTPKTLGTDFNDIVRREGAL
jgi:phage/plasmid primase-like uncharacterized protein